MDRDDLIGAPRRIDTARLWLETPHRGHAAPFLAMLQATMPVLSFVEWSRRALDLEWAQHFCESDAWAVQQGEALVFGAFRREDGHYVGRIDLHTVDFEAPRVEIGYVGDARLSGQGLMREAVLGVIDFAFSLGFARVHALSDVRNQRALHFAHTLGLQHEGVLRGYERHPDGTLADMAMYAALHPALARAAGPPT